MRNKKIKQNYISASEINKFIYCPYQWYYERTYGRRFILEQKNKNKKLKLRVKHNKNFNTKRNLDNNFLRGNKFHREFRKKYTRARNKKIILFLLSLVIFFLGYWISKKYLLVFLVVLAFIKIFFLRQIKKCNKKLPFWPWILIYSDEKISDNQKHVTCSKILISQKYNLSGKPDMIYKNIFTQGLVPIELKSGTIGDRKKPRNGDLFQLVAYFIILKECFKKKPRYGFLIYSDYMFIIPNTKKLRTKIFKALKDMNNILKSGLKTKFISYKKDYSVCKNCICNNSVCKL